MPPGPPPKDPSTRARRNKTTTRATLQPHTQRVPAMPKRKTAWHAMTKQWWRDIWRSPMSPEWDHSDIHNVYILAAVYNDIWTAETQRERQQAAAEYRQQRKDLGLTPFDRRRLEWTIEQADEAKDHGDRRRAKASTAKKKEPAQDPRDVLRVVS